MSNIHSAHLKSIIPWIKETTRMDNLVNPQRTLELEITVSHCPFSDRFYRLAEQSLIARTNLLYISNGEAIDSL